MDSRIPEVPVKMAHVQTQRFKSCNELRLDNETKISDFVLCSRTNVIIDGDNF